MWRIAPLGLRDRFILSSTALITLLMSVVIFFVEMERTAALKERAEDHASAIAQMMADLSENRLMYYDLVALQQNVERVTEDEDVLFAIIFNREAQSLAANQAARELFPEELFVLDNEMGHLERGHVLKAESGFETSDGRNVEVLEVVAPVFVEDELWGAVKLGLSLEEVNAEIQRTRLGLISLGFLGHLRRPRLGVSREPHLSSAREPRRRDHPRRPRRLATSYRYPARRRDRRARRQLQSHDRADSR